MKLKKKVLVFVGIIFVVLIVAGVVTGFKDNARVRNNLEPKYVIKTVSYNGEKVTYWGLGYKVVRYVSISPNEPFKNNIGLKFGSWFMVYKIKNEKVTLSELRDIQQKISNGLNNVVTDNVASVGVNEEKRVVIVELVDNSKEKQQWFRENIYDSKYIVFKQGGPYTTSNGEKMKLNLFDRSEIIKVEINNYSQYKNIFEYTDKDTIDKIYNLFKKLETNIASKSSEPENPEELYTVTFFNDENMLIQSDNDIFKAIVHVYRKNNKYYAEENKNGIYEITEETFNTIKNYTK